MEQQEKEVSLIRQPEKYTPGELYQFTESGEVQPIQVNPLTLERMQRAQLDFKRQQAANNFAYCVLGVGALFIGIIAVMIFGSILVSALRPAPPPEVRINPRCVLFCGSGDQ